MNNSVEGVIVGTTSKSIPVLLRKKADNTELTGIAFGTAGNIASYQRQGTARVAITLATQTVTGAYSSGGFVEIDATNQPGLYRLDVPDAAWAAGADFVVVTIVTTSGYAFYERFNLSANPGCVIDAGVAQAVAASSITLAAANTNATSELVGATVFIKSASTGARQSGRLITAYNAGTKVATIDPAFTTTPTGTIEYEIIGTTPGSTTNPVPVDLRSVLGGAVTATASGVLDVNVKNMNNVVAPTLTGDAYAALTTAVAPPAAMPSTTDTPLNKLNWIHWLFGRRSKMTMNKTTGIETLYKADGVTPLGAATNTDDGTTTTLTPLA